MKSKLEKITRETSKFQISNDKCINNRCRYLTAIYCRYGVKPLTGQHLKRENHMTVSMRAINDEIGALYKETINFLWFT